MTGPDVLSGPDGWWVEVFDGMSADLVSTLASGRSPAGLRSTWRARDAPADLTERSITVDQTQQSVVVGSEDDAVVVKWTVQPTLFASPAPRRTVHLAEVGFRAQPAPLGELYLDTDGGTPVLLASVTRYLPGAQDGWDWYVDDVRAHARGTDVDVLTPADELGRLVAQLHLAFATESSVIHSPRSTADAATVAGWHARAIANLDDALAHTGGPEGERLRALAAKARLAIDRLAAIEETSIQPVHGDLHVGQILRWDGGYAVNDFDGNPVLPPEERLTPQPTARDVAGMLQSLDHVGRVALKHAPDADADAVEVWIFEAHQRFLRAYRETLGASGDLFDERLLEPFAVEQECREYVYAARHLPRWLYVPDAAMPALLA